MPKLHIQLPGNISFTYDDRPLTGVASPRLQIFLAYLVLHRHAPLQRQQIAFQFWPDSTEAQARGNLRFFLYRLRRGETARARTTLVECLTLLTRQGVWRVIPAALAGVAGVLGAAGRTGEGVRLIAAAVAQQDAHGIIWERPDRAEVDRIMAELRAALDPGIFEGMWKEGSALTEQEAVAFAFARVEELPANLN